MLTQRFFIELGYDGTAYSGWQRQPNALSVQEVIETALSKIHGSKSIPLVGCGRTDAGVHARFFVAHTELPMETDAMQLKYKLNKMLPADIVLFRVYPVAESMHARFQATSRTYRYYLHQEKDPFLRNSLFFVGKLDVEQMNVAAQFLLGKQDFTSFSKLHTDVKTNICNISKAVWHSEGNQLYFEITADRFLRNMVRSTVGTLLDVGVGKIQPTEIPTIIAAKDRSAAKLSVEARGLFLWDITYPAPTHLL